MFGFFRSSTAQSAANLARDKSTLINKSRPKKVEPLPPTESEEQLQVIDKVELCYLKAEGYFKRTFKRPEISFKLRGNSAGCAHLQQNRLRFNPKLLLQNTDEFIEQVPAHEVCHLLCHQLYGKVRPHGKEWQALMLALFNLRPDRCHQFEVERKPAKTFEYFCGCGVVNLTIRRHNKVLKGQSQYRCKQCKQILQGKI